MAKGCVCRGVVDGPTRAARGTRMVLHMDLCDACVHVCVCVLQAYFACDGLEAAETRERADLQKL